MNEARKEGRIERKNDGINSLNAELIPIWHLLALLEANHILHVSRIRIKETKEEGRKERRKKK